VHVHCYKVVQCDEIVEGGCSDVPPLICFPDLYEPEKQATLVHMSGGEIVAKVRAVLVD